MMAVRKTGIEIPMLLTRHDELGQETARSYRRINPSGMDTTTMMSAAANTSSG